MKNLENLINYSTVFIVTDNNLDRSAWKRAMNSLGIHPDRIRTFEGFADALEALEGKVPMALVTAYEIGGECAGELMRKFREKLPDRSEAILGALADSTDELLELEILEQEVDVFLKKPYAANDLKSAFEKAFKAKAELNWLEKKVHKSFNLLKSNEIEKIEAAIEVFESKCPDFEIYKRLKAALFHAKGDHAQEARALKESGIESYQILVQCFDAFVLDNNPQEAFKIGNKILERFYFHPKRIANYIKVCILTANYHSLINFALIHLPLSEGENKRAMAAALAISSKSIGLADKARAIEAATLAVKYGKDNKAIIEKALRSLLDLRQIKIVKRLSNELAEYDSLAEALAVTDYLVLHQEGGEPFALFKTGMDLTNKGVRDFHVYEILLKSAKLSGRKRHALEELAEDAIKQYPEKKEYFRSLVA